MRATPKAEMLLDAIAESLLDLSTECWTKVTREQLKRVEAEQVTLRDLLTEENTSGMANGDVQEDIQ